MKAWLIGSWQSAGALVLCLSTAVPAWADLNAEAFALYGGTYAASCADPAAVRLRVAADSLVIEKSGRTMTARSPEPSYSFFGAQSPPHFQVALTGALRAGVDVTFLVYRDPAGRYVELQTDPKVMAALGLRATDTTRYRDCDAARRSRDGAAAARDERSQTQAARTAALASPLADPEFKRLYLAALGGKARDSWLARLDGPSPDQKSVKVDGFDYVELASCKAHDCHDNNLVLLFSRDAGKVYGLVFEGNARTTLIGNPPPAVATELRRLWQAEWRQGR